MKVHQEFWWRSNGYRCEPCVAVVQYAWYHHLCILSLKVLVCWEYSLTHAASAQSLKGSEQALDASSASKGWTLNVTASLGLKFFL